MTFIYSFIKRRRVERSTRDDNNDAAPCHPQVQPHPRRFHLSIALSLIDQPRHDPMYFVFSTSESFAHWASSSLQTVAEGEFGVLGDDLGSHVSDEALEGVFERPFFLPGRPCAVSSPVSLLRLPPRPAHTRECCAGLGVFKMLEDNSRDVYAGFKGEPSFIMVGVRHAVLVRGEVLSRGLFRGLFCSLSIREKQETGEEQYPNPTARRAVDALTRAAGSHRSLRAAVEHVHTVPAPRGVAGRTSRHERRAGLHEPAGRVRIGHHRRIDDSGRRRLRVVPDASLAPRAVDLTAGRRAILAQVRIDQVRGQTRTEPRANGGSQSKVEGAAIAGPTISQNRL